MTEHYSRARNWVDEFLYFNRDWEASVFSPTIRVLGGLLANTTSPAEMYVEKCVERLDALATPSGQDGHRRGRARTLAEFGSLAMEFGALSERVDPKNEKWRVLGETPVRVALRPRARHARAPRLVPPCTSSSARARGRGKVSVGAMGDGWYEYLLKVWVQGGRTEALRGWLDAW